MKFEIEWLMKNNSHIKQTLEREYSREYLIEDIKLRLMKSEFIEIGNTVYRSTMIDGFTIIDLAHPYSPI